MKSHPWFSCVPYEVLPSEKRPFDNLNPSKSHYVCNFPPMYNICNLFKSHKVPLQNKKSFDHDEISKCSFLDSQEESPTYFPYF